MLSLLLLEIPLSLLVSFSFFFFACFTSGGEAFSLQVAEITEKSAVSSVTF